MYQCLVFPKKDFIFQQDLAPAHRASATANFLRSHNVNVLDWPGNFPDANIIENLWGYMTWKLRNVVVAYADKYWKEIQNVWYNIPKEYIHGLYESLPSRITAITRARGGATKF